TGSVPSKNAQLPPSCHTGGARVKSRYCSLGGCGEMTSAKIARNKSSTIRASPINAPRLCEYACQNSASDPGASAGLGVTAIAASFTTTSCMANAGIDHAIQEIDDEIHRDHDRRDQQYPALHD